MEHNSRLPQRAVRWLKIKTAEFTTLLKAIQQFGLFSQLIRFRIVELSVYTFIYPVARIILGRENASNMCERLIKEPKPTIFPFPIPLKSKLLIKDNGTWTVVMEIFINDIYQKDTLQEGMTIIDIGAHIGGQTVYFAEKVSPTGKVIAIEPEPKNYQELLDNMRLNGFTNVTAIQAALSDKNSIEKLYINSSSTGHSLLPQLAKNSKTSPFIPIEVKTLDTVLQQLQVNKIDVIKIDAEGMEIPILQGATQTLKNNPQAKIIVASYHYPEEIQEVKSFLSQMGFTTKVSPFGIVMTI